MNVIKKVILLLILTISSAVFAADKPNIILILLDDLGWRDVGFMDNTFIETPTLDRLAKEGLVFTNAYSNAPNCAPSRAAIMSGQYAPRTGVYTMIKGDMGDERLRRVLTPENKMYLEPHTITLAEMLKSAGYRTAHIGKWNLGSGNVRGPLGQGFDINIAGERNGYPHNGYFAPYDLPGLEKATKDEYLTDRLTQETVEFIKNHSATQRAINEKNRQPFFIYLSHFAPHYPIQAPQDLNDKYNHKLSQQKKLGIKLDQQQSGTYAAMIDSVDQGVAKILLTLNEQGLDKNTLIIFTSDNGGHDRYSYMSPLRGGKSLLYEGGVRVPMFIWWPQHISPNQTDEPVMGIDIFPTLMNAAGIKSVNQPLDGSDLFPLFIKSSNPERKATKASLDRDALYWYFPGYVAGNNEQAADDVFQQRPAAVIRKQDWKLIQYFDSSKVELYNLKEDPSEKNNLANLQLDKRMELSTQLQQWLIKMKAPGSKEQPLTPNPLYDEHYENNAINVWLRKIIMKLFHTRYGATFQEKDL